MDQQEDSLSVGRKIGPGQAAPTIKSRKNSRSGGRKKNGPVRQGGRIDRRETHTLLEEKSGPVRQGAGIDRRETHTLLEEKRGPVRQRLHIPSTRKLTACWKIKAEPSGTSHTFIEKKTHHLLEEKSGTVRYHA
jgi:hypothetical protein